jgi:hypothetical protein
MIARACVRYSSNMTLGSIPGSCPKAAALPVRHSSSSLDVVDLHCLYHTADTGMTKATQDMEGRVTLRGHLQSLCAPFCGTPVIDFFELNSLSGDRQMAATPLAEFEYGISWLSFSPRLWGSFVAGSSVIFQLRSDLEFYLPTLLILSCPRVSQTIQTFDPRTDI